jgi:hypothetical protein
MLDWNMNNCQTLIKQCNANVLHVNSMTYMSLRGNNGDLTDTPTLKKEKQSVLLQFLMVQGSLKRKKIWLVRNAYFHNLWNISPRKNAVFIVFSPICSFLTIFLLKVE